MQLTVTAKTLNQDGRIQETHLPDTIVVVKVRRNWGSLFKGIAKWTGILAAGALAGWSLPLIVSNEHIQNVLRSLGQTLGLM